MFDVDQFVLQCQQALSVPEPARRVEQLLGEALQDIAGLRAALGGGAKAVFQPLYRSAELTVANMSTAPGSTSPIHNHCMWGVIAVYDGQEDSLIYQRGDDGLTLQTTRQLRSGDLFAMPVEMIHAIHNPLAGYNAALHVYGGDLVERPGRSLWNPHTDVEEPYDLQQVLAYTRELSA